MAQIFQKQVSGLISALAAKDTITSVDSKDASVLAAANSVGTNLSVDSKDASVLVAAEAYADNIESGLHNYLEEAGTYNTTNVFGLAGNFDVAGGDFEVYINGMRIAKKYFTLTPGSDVSFNSTGSNLGYDVEATDEVSIHGHIA